MKYDKRGNHAKDMGHARDIRDQALPLEDAVTNVTSTSALANPEEWARHKQFAKEQLAKWLKERYGDY